MIWAPSHSDGNRNTDEEHVDREVHVLDTVFITELVVQAPRDGTSKPERHRQAREGHRCRDTPIAHQEAHVGLQADHEEVQHETKICDEVEVDDGLLGEDGIAEARDMPHDGGPQDDSADDLSDDARLADLGEGPVEDMADDDDQAGLRYGLGAVEPRHVRFRGRRELTWMMKSTMGSLGLYWDGFEPSMTPPCEGARSAEAVASTAAEVTLARISEAVVVAIASGLKVGGSLGGKPGLAERSAR